MAAPSVSIVTSWSVCLCGDFWFGHAKHWADDWVNLKLSEAGSLWTRCKIPAWTWHQRSQICWQDRQRWHGGLRSNSCRSWWFALCSCCLSISL